MDRAPDGPHRGLGWKPGRGSDPHRFPMRAVLETVPPATTSVRRWWANGWWGDQGQTAQCTIYSWLHLLADGPITQLRLVPTLDPTSLYQEGQRIDGTPTSDVYSGLTTDAAAQVIKRHGWIGAYHWAATADEIIETILRVGPVTLGLDWRDPMFSPDPKTARVRYEGPVAGGHQVVLDAANRDQELVRIKNSWGRSYGRAGFVFLSFDDLRAVMANGGEACVATEIRAHLVTP